jgi:hypothetical protein
MFRRVLMPASLGACAGSALIDCVAATPGAIGYVSKGTDVWGSENLSG